jgi:putative transposase
MPRKAQLIKLSNDDLSSLKNILRKGAAPARTQTRARVLDLLHRGQHPDLIAETLQISGATVFNIKRRFLDEGLDATLVDKPRSGKPPTIDGQIRAQITALACSQAPEGHASWTLRLLADKAVELGFVDRISHTGVRKILKKTASSRT